ncbi:carnitine O-acetyltransferase b [Pygocentrus nattereri]|uniref:Choline/carnitine acyltransferase domain-containing protein n=1 Tax=Pygocentrus nattereri TaxID=42514 RepID=A0AAR2INV9_PYGNA|nr:carnitine O-acetyltransferase b [Pygocentrus nattereri]
MILEKLSRANFVLRSTALVRQAHSSSSSSSSTSVPPQPVPPLAHTLQKYLTALQPLLPPDELEHTRKMVQRFGSPGGLGKKLQQGLEKRARHSHNWITDWWVQWAYLESRQPLAVHSNPAISLPRQDFSDWRGQLVFAAKLISAVLDFKARVDNGHLPVEYMRGRPLCMELYPQLFSSCRVPGPKHDHVVHYGRPRRGPTHITVVRNYQFFQLDVYNSDGTPLTQGQIHAQLCRIRSQSWKTDKEPMGILTSEHRHTWGQAYNRLLHDRINKESVRLIEKGIFTLCLDSPVMRISDEKYASRMAAQILHGGGTYSNSGNRWFDKTVQFVVGEDGSWGLLYEQATAEGPPVSTLLDHVLQYCKKTDTVRAPLIPLPMPKKLYFYIDPAIKWDIEMAKQNLDILINDLDITCFNFQRFGKEFPKRLRLSPNSVIQVAIQLAYYRVHSEVCAACDIASLRMFRGGRTDYIRSPTNQMLSFIQAFDDPAVSREAKIELLREAAEAYSQLTDQALHGHGIDRHLLGLKLQAIEEGLSVPRMFMDTAYGLATHWKLRTGQVPTNTDSVMCFGPLVPDGYAVCYNPQPDHVHFSVTAFNCCEETNAEKLADTLESTLCDIQELLHPPA